MWKGVKEGVRNDFEVSFWGMLWRGELPAAVGNAVGRWIL